MLPGQGIILSMIGMTLHLVRDGKKSLSEDRETACQRKALEKTVKESDVIPSGVNKKARPAPGYHIF
jgi:hypothetical protein